MATIITRAVGATAKGSALTNAELDNNFINLNTAKLEAVNIQPVHGVDISVVDGNVLIDVKNFGGTCKNTSGSSIPKGTPVYQTGVQGTSITVAPADASDPNKMPAVGVLGETHASEAEGDIIYLGYITGVNTSGFAVGDEVYVAAGGGYTNAKPTNSSGHLIQFLGVVNRVDANNGSGIIFGTATAQTQSLEKTDTVVFAGVNTPAVTGLLAPVNGTDAANKTYVDNSAPPPAVSTITSNHTATAIKGTVVLLCNTGSGSITVTLPSAVENTAIYNIKKIASANSLTINTTSSQTIDGSSSVVVTENYESLTLVSDNVNWNVI